MNDLFHCPITLTEYPVAKPARTMPLETAQLSEHSTAAQAPETLCSIHAPLREPRTQHQAQNGAHQVDAVWDLRNHVLGGSLFVEMALLLQPMQE